ncbi:MAG: translation initiation factor IF-2 N-terminal domain-containing protein, partial [Bacillota bacterium]
MEKKRVYELAKELGQDSKKILDALAKLGVEVKNHMSTVEPDVAEQVVGMLKAPGRAKASAAKPAADATATAVKAPPARGARTAAPAKASTVEKAAAPARAGAEPAQGAKSPAARPPAGSPPVQRLYNTVDLRTQETAFRPAPSQRPGPGREAPRAGG